MSHPEHDGSDLLAEVSRIVERGGDADDVLRAVLAAMHRLYPYVALRFVEDGDLVPGPDLGAAASDMQLERFPISYQGVLVGELITASSDEDRALLETIAARIAAHVLLGWDTGGETWES